MITAPGILVFYLRRAESKTHSSVLIPKRQSIVNLIDDGESIVFLSKKSNSKLLLHSPPPQRPFYQDWVICSVITTDFQWNHTILMAVTVPPQFSLIFK